MPGFAQPLWLLLPAAVLVAWRWHRRRKPALRYSSAALFDGLPVGRAGRVTRLAPVLRGLALGLLVLAAANPRFPDRTARIPADGIAVVLALDVSNSMAAADFAWAEGEPPVSRLEAAKRAFALFAAGGAGPGGETFAGRPTDSLGLVAFAAVPRTPCPLTLNRSVLLTVLNEQQPRGGIDSGTNIGDAVAEGLHRVDAAGAKRKVLILLSDGEHNVTRTGPDAPLKPLEAAELARALGVPVYTVDCGGDPSSVADADAAAQRADGRRVLEQLAAVTGGKSFTANDGAGLRAAYAAVDALERTPVESFRYRRSFDVGPWLGLAGFIVLAGLHFLEATRWRAVP